MNTESAQPKPRTAEELLNSFNDANQQVSILISRLEKVGSKINFTYLPITTECENTEKDVITVESKLREQISTLNKSIGNLETLVRGLEVFV